MTKEAFGKISSGLQDAIDMTGAALAEPASVGDLLRVLTASPPSVRPCADLDIAIGKATGIRSTRWASMKFTKGSQHYEAVTQDETGCGHYRFTRRLDDALRLVPTGFGWSLQGNTDIFYATVKGHSSSGSTPELALAIAALKARCETEARVTAQDDQQSLRGD